MRILTIECYFDQASSWLNVLDALKVRVPLIHQFLADEYGIGADRFGIQIYIGDSIKTKRWPWVVSAPKPRR